MAATGTACIFFLPYHVHRAEACVAPVAVRVRGYNLVVFPPFRNGAGIPLHRDLALADLPFPAGTTRPDTLLPELRIGASPGWPEPFLTADALRIDFQGLLAEDDLTPARNVAERLLRIFRFVTRQWWITRGHSESLAPLQHHFPIRPDGQPANGQLYGTHHVIPWLGTEQLLTQNLLARCCAFLETDGDIPVSVSHLLDAVYSSNHQDRHAAVLSAATACEALFAEQAYQAAEDGRASKSTARKAVKISDLRIRVHDGAIQVFGRSFQDDDPGGYAAMADLWVARHAVAHGSTQQQSRRLVFTDQENLTRAMGAAFAFFTWMANLVPRSWPDPMQALTAPLVPPNR
jgi:hypothetical protein